MWVLAVAENRTAHDAQLSPEFSQGSSEQWESTAGASYHVGNV